MPRDLFSRPSEDGDSATSPDGISLPNLTREQDSQEAANSSQEMNNLHPFTQQLTVADVESCAILEEAAFPPQERCTREKFKYRFESCGELCLGLFTSVEGDSDLATFKSANPISSSDSTRKAVLLAHIVVTKTDNKTVTDDDMALPPSNNSDPRLGHKEFGRTVCLHSLAVLPGLQKMKLGTTLMKAYIERLENEDVADSIALIAHDHLVGFYEKFGFQSFGKSAAQFGGGGWYDMVRELDLKRS